MGMAKKMIECNLCGIQFHNDIVNRKKVHERWHTNCKIEKRNTTEGKVQWI